MSKTYPCPNGIEDDCGYLACAHAMQCERAAQERLARTPCSRCSGVGHIVEEVPPPFGAMEIQDQPELRSYECPACNGAGELPQCCDQQMERVRKAESFVCWECGHKIPFSERPMTIRAAMDSTTKEKAGRRRMRLFVVPLRVSRNDGKEQRLLPHRRLAGAIKPGVSGLAWATKGGNDHGGGIRGERFSEGHAGILPSKKKSAMQKKSSTNVRNADKLRACPTPTQPCKAPSGKKYSPA